MSDKANNVYEAAMALSIEERAEVVGKLLDTLEDDDKLDAAQEAELMRRSDEVDRGVAPLISGDEAMRLFRERKKA